MQHTGLWTNKEIKAMDKYYNTADESIMAEHIKNYVTQGHRLDKIINIIQGLRHQGLDWVEVGGKLEELL